MIGMHWVKRWATRAVLAGWPLTMCAQTKVDLANQARDIDFTAAASTKPMKSGASLPAQCSLGEAFFLNSAAPGQNLYSCTGVNIWSLEAGGGNSPLTAITATLTNATTLTIGAACSLTAPCNSRVGGTVYTYQQNATATLASGSTTVRIYISDGSDGAPAGTIKVRNAAASGVTCSAGCTVENSQSAFPGMSIPLAMWAASSPGQWDPTGMDLRAFLATKPSPSAGSGVQITSGSVDAIAADRTAIPLKYSGLGAPGSISGSLQGDFYSDTANDDSYQCFAAGPCTGVAPGNWVKLSTGPTPFLDTPWFFYGHGSSSAGQNPSLGGGRSNRLVILGKVSTTAREIKRVAVAVVAGAINNCGSGTSACGMRMALLSEDRATVLCKTVAGYGGNPATEMDLNTTGSKSLPFLSGAQVVSGVCTLANGNYWFAISTDSNELLIAADSSATAGNLLSNAMPGNVLLGQIANGTAGSGTTLDFGDLSGALAPSANVAIPMLVGLN